MGPVHVLREQALGLLARSYAAGHLRTTTLEHRVEAALRAETPEELSAVTWDLPALDATLGTTFRTLLGASPPHARCTRVSFKAVPEVVLDVDCGPRTAGYLRRHHLALVALFFPYKQLGVSCPSGLTAISGGVTYAAATAPAPLAVATSQPGFGGQAASAGQTPDGWFGAVNEETTR